MRDSLALDGAPGTRILWMEAPRGCVVTSGAGADIMRDLDVDTLSRGLVVGAVLKGRGVDEIGTRDRPLINGRLNLVRMLFIQSPNPAVVSS